MVGLLTRQHRDCSAALLIEVDQSFSLSSYLPSIDCIRSFYIVDRTYLDYGKAND